MLCPDSLTPPQGQCPFFDCRKDGLPMAPRELSEAVGNCLQGKVDQCLADVEGDILKRVLCTIGQDRVRL